MDNSTQEEAVMDYSDSCVRIDHRIVGQNQTFVKLPVYLHSCTSEELLSF